MKTVYVLGAGFSRPLGGPLLGDLFTVTSWEIATQRYSTLSDDLPAKWAAEMYRRGPMSASTSANETEFLRFWSDPEEFLEVLETCVHENAISPRSPKLVETMLRQFNEHFPKSSSQLAGFEPADEFDFIPRVLLTEALSSGCLDRRVSDRKNRMRNLVYRDPKVWLRLLLDGAKRLLAAECSSFFDATDTEFDKWSPYHKWLARLTAEDTIITFNYDLVLETIATQRKLRNVKVVLPGETLTGESAVILKLHGSVDWRRDGGRVVRELDSIPFAIVDRNGMSVLGTPGPEKLANRNDVLNSLWSMAGERIRRADRIVFLGYRMPPTDAYARRFLAEVIPNSPETRLRVQIVLGPPELSDGHATRLERIMLALINSQSVVERLPLGAEDFLDLEPQLLGSGGRRHACLG